MATFQPKQFTIPNGKALKLLDYFASHHNYQDTIDGQPNPETKAQFMQRKMDEHIETWLRNIFRTEKERELQSGQDFDLQLS